MPRAPSTDWATRPTSRNSRKVSMARPASDNGRSLQWMGAPEGASRQSRRASLHRQGLARRAKDAVLPEGDLSSVRLPQAKLDQVLDRFHQVEARMGAASDGAEIVRLSKEHAEMKPVVDAVSALARAGSEIADLEAMTADPEMGEMAAEELDALKERLPQLEREVALLLAPRDADENASAVLEVRAGTGGDEAALFAGDLFRMYSRYASTRGWRVEVDSATEGEAGGYKEIIATVTGDGVFGRLKFESGVHRVQRVPATEAGGRIHTSAATVAVLPEVEDVEIEIRD